MIYGYDGYNYYCRPEVGDYEECPQCKRNTWRCIDNVIQPTRTDATCVCDYCRFKSMTGGSVPERMQFYRLPKGSTVEDGLHACKNLKNRYKETHDQSLIYKF
jgi:hypothetical protein